MPSTIWGGSGPPIPLPLTLTHMLPISGLWPADRKIGVPQAHPKGKMRKITRAAGARGGKWKGNGGAPQARPLFRRRRRRKRKKFGGRRRRAPQNFGAAGAGKSGRTLCRFSCRLQIFFFAPGPCRLLIEKKRKRYVDSPCRL